MLDFEVSLVRMVGHAHGAARGGEAGFGSVRERALTLDSSTILEGTLRLLILRLLIDKLGLREEGLRQHRSHI